MYGHHVVFILKKKKACDFKMINCAISMQHVMC